MTEQSGQEEQDKTMASPSFLKRFNPDFRDWAKKLRERPAGANPLSGREVMVAAVNKLLRLAFALVKNQTLYQIPESQPVEITI